MLSDRADSRPEVDTVFASLLPPLSVEEFAALKSSIESEGIRDPIVLDEQGNILDGHHRFKVDANAPYRILEGADKMSEGEKKAFVFAVNFTRRNLSVEQKHELREAMKTLALDLRAQDVKTYTEVRLAEMFGVERSTVAKWIASDVNVHNTCVDARITIPKAAYPIIAERAEKGESQEQIAADYGVSHQRISQIVQGQKKRERREPDPLPKEKYRCIVIDPPWPIEKIDRQVRPRQAAPLDYPTMSLPEIAALPIPRLAYKAGCHVYLWTTHRFLHDAFHLFDGWGVRYECLLTWVKNVGMTPYSWMYSTEHVLFGRIGHLKLANLGIRLDFAADVQGHSTKPDKFYELISTVSPSPRLDMFARKRRKEFIPWGNEA